MLITFSLTTMLCTESCSLLSLPPQKKIVSYRKLRAIDLGTFCEDRQSTSLCSNPAADIDDLVLQCNTVLQELMGSHAPMKSQSFVERPLIPLITIEITEAKKGRKKSGEKVW